MRLAPAALFLERRRAPKPVAPANRVPLQDVQSDSYAMNRRHPNALRLHALVAEIVRIPEDSIDGALDMETCSTWDSLSHMELIASIEDEFSIDLSADEIAEMTSVDRIETVLRRRSVDI
jgi:acyl carrier protein